MLYSFKKIALHTRMWESKNFHRLLTWFLNVEINIKRVNKCRVISLTDEPDCKVQPTNDNAY